MLSAEKTVTIDRPIETVFAFFADAENEAKWRPTIKSIKRIGEDLGSGAHYQQQMSGPGGRAIPADFDITSFEPNSLMGFKTTTGPVRPEGEFRFREAGDGTEVTFALEATLTGLKKLLLSGQVRKAFDGEVASLDKAKQVLEQEPRGTATDQEPGGIADPAPGGIADQEPGGIADQEPGGIADQEPGGIADQDD